MSLALSGSVTLGTNLMDAFKKLDMLEHTARILWLAHVAKGGLDPLPPEDVRKLLETRRLFGDQHPEHAREPLQDRRAELIPNLEYERARKPTIGPPA